ncbi:cytochrome c553 [Methylohalomonas lacus]|uniref:Cytochrome c553 n=1 Tax=Methylohalomonas lacus TaxID=398773 RepID=A0AAE3HKC3_9GAMM|nr:cytochrome c4 [Methylohalomonas lacus]MCS3902053.1 cytochrome c553 [Methylohalomonas lacus]
MLRLYAALLFIMTPFMAVTAETAVNGDPDAGKKKAQSCAACHGADGNSSNADWPKIAGQQADYIVTQLQAYKSGARENPQMSPMAQDLSEQDMHDLAAYFSSQEITLETASEEAIEQAETLYRAGKADAGMPACIACHGPKGNGVPGAGYPRISGQHAAYTAATLKAYRAGERGGGQADMMTAVAKHLSDEEIKALAEYVSGLY